MSTRAISSATGLGYGTVYRELSTDPDGSVATPSMRKEPVSPPAKVTGTNGKTYVAAVPQPKRAKKQTNIRGVIGVFSASDLT